MQSKEILVTGASGFVGKHLAERLLLDEYQIITPNHAEGFDITDEDAVLSLPKSNCVIHLAAMAVPSESWNSPNACIETNITGTLNVLKYCERHKARLIFASSYMYGNLASLPTSEDQPEQVENPYAVSKLAAEKMCYVFGKKAGLDVTVLRIFNIYGPGQSEKLVISQMISQLVNTGRITINGGSPKRDFLYIADLIEAYIKVVVGQKEGYRVYNVGSGKNISIIELANNLVKISNTDAKIEDRKISRPNEIMETLADTTRIQKELDWRPKISIEEGLRETYLWYVKQQK